PLPRPCAPVRVRCSDPARLPLLPELRADARRAVGQRRRVRGDRDRDRARRLMPTTLAERERAIAAADGTCPRCGAARATDQRYCLECGFALPIVEGRIPRLRRRWLRRFGWYPGDWIWLSLPTLLIAILGAAAAIAITEERS